MKKIKTIFIVDPNFISDLEAIHLLDGKQEIKNILRAEFNHWLEEKFIDTIKKLGPNQRLEISINIVDE